FNALTVKTTGAIEMFRNRLENWYDTNMDRITGTMKALYTKNITMITAIIITLLLNADTIAISKYLYSNEEARAKVASKAYETGRDQKIKKQMDTLKNSLHGDTAKILFSELKGSIDSNVS